MRVLGAIFVLAIAAAGIALVYIYAGGYDVAATAPHGSAGRWLLETTKRNSVQAGARNIVPPDRFDDPAAVAAGGKMYGALCQTCHGGPGVMPAEIARGLAPEPPDLGRSARNWKPRELFWIVKHGISMTGMPAWGPTHKDAALWSVIAFVEKLPTMTPADYQAYARGDGPHEEPKIGRADDDDDTAAPNGRALDATQPPSADNAEATSTPNSAPETNQALQTGPRPRVRALPEPKPPVPQPPRRRRR